MQIRKATNRDAEFIHKMANDYAASGFLLPRSLSSIYESIRDYAIVEKDGEAIATGALKIIWNDLAEIRTLAVSQEYMRQGVGTSVVEYFLKEAEQMGLNQVFTLTYVPEFFRTCGFHEVSKDKMPQKFWKDCIHCPKFPHCDEVCMVKELVI